MPSARSVFILVADHPDAKKPVTFCFFITSINQLDVLSGIAIAGGLYLFFVGFRMLARKRLLMATRTSKIRSAALGLVEVNGMAVGPHTMPAPITGKPCFLYHTTAWQQRAGKEKEWEKVADETLHVPFFVDDSTGRLLVEPLGADLDLHRDFREEYDKSFFASDLNSVPPRVSVFLARHGVSPSRSLRVEERLIKPDDWLFIAGTLAENPGIRVRPFMSSGGSEANPMNGNSLGNSAAPQVVNLSGGPLPSSIHEMTQQQKIAAALTRAGITRPEAWAVAGVPYEGDSSDPATVQSSPRLASVTFSVQSDFNASRNTSGKDASDPDLIPPVVLMKGTNDPTFVISYRSQQEFLSALAWKSAAMVWGGGGLVLVGVYVLLSQMQLF